MLMVTEIDIIWNALTSTGFRLSKLYLASETFKEKYQMINKPKSERYSISVTVPSSSRFGFKFLPFRRRDFSQQLEHLVDERNSHSSHCIQNT